MHWIFLQCDQYVMSNNNQQLICLKSILHFLTHMTELWWPDSALRRKWLIRVKGLFLLVTIAFWKGHSVARYVCSLAPLTRSAALHFAMFASLARSLRSQARSLTSLPPFRDNWNSWICIHAAIACKGNKRDSCRHYKHALILRPLWKAAA